MKRLAILAIAAGVVVLALAFRFGLRHDDESIGLPNVDWTGWSDDDRGEGWPW